jgi:hypothetical protein
VKLDVEFSVEPGPIKAYDFTTPTNIAPQGVSATPVGAGGTFAAGTYFWKLTFVDGFGETMASAEVSATIVLNGSATIAWTVPPAGALGVNVYRGTAAGAENRLIATASIVSPFTDTGTAGSVASPPTQNTSRVGDTVIFAGGGILLGWSLRETTGLAPAVVEIQDGGIVTAEVAAPAGLVADRQFSSSGVTLNTLLRVHTISGMLTGAFLATPYC